MVLIPEKLSGCAGECEGGLDIVTPTIRTLEMSAAKCGGDTWGQCVVCKNINAEPQTFT